METRFYENFEKLFVEANLNFIDFDSVVDSVEMPYTFCADNDLKLTRYGKELFKELLSAPCKLVFYNSRWASLPTCIIEGVSGKVGRKFFAACAGDIDDEEYHKIFTW